MSEKNSEPNLWALLSEKLKEADTYNQVEKSKATKNNSPKKDLFSKKWKISRFFLDIVSSLFWFYVIFNTFLFDLDSYLKTLLGTNYEFLIDYKFVIFTSIIVLLGIFFWRWKTLLYLSYVVFFFPILFFWKIPKIILKRRSFVLGFAYVDIILRFFRNLRYNIISKSLTAVAGLFILISTNQLILSISAILMILIAFYSISRFAYYSFKPDWFLTSQEKLLNVFTQKKEKTEEEKVAFGLIKDQKINSLNSAQLTLVRNNITNTILGNKILLIWGERLQKFKNSGIGYLSSISLYLAQVLSTTFYIWLTHVAINKIQVNQYAITGNGSNLEFLLYTFSTYGLGQDPGIQAVGWASQSLVLITVILVPLFLLLLVVSIYIDKKVSSDNKKLDTIVSSLEEKSKKMDEDFKKTYSLTISEAEKNIDDVTKGLSSALKLIDKLLDFGGMNSNSKKKDLTQIGHLSIVLATNNFGFQV